jgi:kynurenine formamidase
MSMKIIDLTRVFGEHMPVYPGDPEATLIQSSHVGVHGFSDHVLHTGMHVGTHIDAPMHMIEDGAHIDDVPLSQLIGRGVVIDARGGSQIDAALLSRYTFKKGDVVLVCTGWGSAFGTADYFTGHPELTPDAAHVLVAAGVAAVGTDTPSPDTPPFEIHKIFLGASVLILENLCSLETLLGENQCTIYAVPMKLHADAAPARVFALCADATTATIEPGVYQHYKGKEYDVIGLGHHSETCEPLVVYRARYDSDDFGPKALWVRPVSLFLDTVIVDGAAQPRFKKVS